MFDADIFQWNFYSLKSTRWIIIEWFLLCRTHSPRYDTLNLVNKSWSRTTPIHIHHNFGESYSMNKNFRTRGIKISVECVYELFIEATQNYLKAPKLKFRFDCWILSLEMLKEHIKTGCSHPNGNLFCLPSMTKVKERQFAFRHKINFHPNQFMNRHWRQIW